jgi:hypothetical protein
MEFCFENGNIPLILTSAYTGDNVEEAFSRLASMILTKIELGTIDPEDFDSGVQYGEVPRWDLTVSRNRTSLLTLLGGQQRTNRTNKRRNNRLIDFDNGNPYNYSRNSNCC